MTFFEWLTSTAHNPRIEGQWKLPHILTLVITIALIIFFSLTLRKKSRSAKKTLLWVIVGILLFFEITRRSINLAKKPDATLIEALRIILPRPWCAISVWFIIFSPVVDKKWFYNYTAITSLLCAVVFFAYPGAGFNHQFIEFENLYSITTHSLILLTSIILITLNFTDFKYKGSWREWLTLTFVYLYAFLEIILNIEGDPLFFMPGGDAQVMFSINYETYLVIYITFIILYFNVFYLIGDRKNIAEALNKNKNNHAENLQK